MHVTAHEGCTDTVRESALKVGSGRKSPRCTRELNLPQQHACPTLYQLNYIPAPHLRVHRSSDHMKLFLHLGEELTLTGLHASKNKWHCWLNCFTKYHMHIIHLKNLTHSQN